MLPIVRYMEYIRKWCQRHGFHLKCSNPVPGIIRKSMTDYTPWFSGVFSYTFSSKFSICVCMKTVCVFLWRSQTSTQLFFVSSVSVSQWAQRELAELEASVDFGQHLQSSLFFPRPSRQNNQILDLYAGVSCQGAELTPSDQTTTRNEGLCCSPCLLCAAEKYAATHTHTNALCVNLYTPAVTDLWPIQDQQSVRLRSVK